PLSYALLLVVASSFHAPDYAVVVIGAELISAALRITHRSAGWRAQIMIERFIVAAGTIVAYDIVRALTNHQETVNAVLLTLGVAAVSQIPVDLFARWILRLQPSFSPRT